MTPIQIIYESTGVDAVDPEEPKSNTPAAEHRRRNPCNRNDPKSSPSSPPRADTPDNGLDRRLRVCIRRPASMTILFVGATRR